MAQASRKHFGPGGNQGKGSGTGGRTDLSKQQIGENMVLSNRDKSRHSDQRGMDGRDIETEQLQDHAANRLSDEDDRSSSE
jgi:hypothetical protein